MKLTFYHIPLCPRCARARIHLASLLGQSYRRHVEEVNALAHPLNARQNGIRMVPALTHGSSQLSGIVLSREQIEQFLDACGFTITEANDFL